VAAVIEMEPTSLSV